MNRNLRTIITDKDGFLTDYEPKFGVTIRYVLRPFFDFHHTEELIKTRKLPDGRTKYYIRTNVGK